MQTSSDIHDSACPILTYIPPSLPIPVSQLTISQVNRIASAKISKYYDTMDQTNQGKTDMDGINSTQVLKLINLVANDLCNCQVYYIIC